MIQSIIKTETLLEWVSSQREEIRREMVKHEKNEAIMVGKIAALQKKTELLNNLSDFINDNCQDENLVFDTEIFA
ncbi:MAG: hypothetical protein K9I82_12385 [Chitinophagaceae bacterium]|nr:hypothetical protein [Chitinophagaceae bacterium]